VCLLAGSLQAQTLAEAAALAAAQRAAHGEAAPIVVTVTNADLPAPTVDWAAFIADIKGPATPVADRATAAVVAPKPITVRTYTKTDGTVVTTHRRAAPSSSATAATPTAPSRIDPASIPRDQHGRILRSGTAKGLFMKLTGFPKGRPGYVVDHIIPLACGGPDMPTNMQWQTIAQGKLKDKSERKDCQ
jgi:hypothetical protein